MALTDRASALRETVGGDDPCRSEHEGAGNRKLPDRSRAPDSHRVTFLKDVPMSVVKRCIANLKDSFQDEQHVVKVYDAGITKSVSGVRGLQELSHASAARLPGALADGPMMI
jgi:hypothetical protein